MDQTVKLIVMVEEISIIMRTAMKNLGSVEITTNIVEEIRSNPSIEHSEIWNVPGKCLEFRFVINDIRYCILQNRFDMGKEAAPYVFDTCYQEMVDRDLVTGYGLKIMTKEEVELLYAGINSYRHLTEQRDNTEEA